MFKKFLRVITVISTLFCLGVIILSIGGVALVFYVGRDLPDHKQLANYKLPTISRIYASNGQVIAEYADERRLFVPIHAIPKPIINAFIAAEDKNFYKHKGIDYLGIVRAMVTNFKNIGMNRRPVGASTITQQVVKNFLLDNEASLKRKIKEAILSIRISEAYSKDQIMELYLNKIYLGNQSYGIAAAALNYFNKPINELTVEEAALLAAMPKAPSNLNPYTNYDKAKERRDWVISRMEEDGLISDVEALLATSVPINLVHHKANELVNAGFFADSVKQQVDKIVGVGKINKEGYAINSTIEPDLQKIAENALIKGLRDYDRRHGWRGAIKNLPHLDNWQEELKKISSLDILAVEHLAIVLELQNDQVKIGLKNGEFGIIKLENMKWARKYINENSLGPAVNKPKDVLKKGDIVVVSFIDKNKYELSQIPQINGAIVAMNANNGHVYAMAGGYLYNKSPFNRAVQALRQPGSAFKPFVYLAALESGYRPNSIVLDEEVQMNFGANLPAWRPQNHTGDFLGPVTLRTGVEKSRNAMTVRLAQSIGIDKVIEVAKRLDIKQDIQRNFSIVLGTGETNLLALSNAYASLVNGGKKVSPIFVQKIQDRDGKIVYTSDKRECKNCNIDPENIDKASLPILDEYRESIIDPVIAYQMTSILEGVVQRGTARDALSLNRTIGGKTGTTNDSFDTWFVGFTSDLVVGVFAGFDKPKSLGHHEYGSNVALPIWIDFMKEALKNVPDTPFRKPNGIKLVKIDKNTGLLPSSSTNPANVIYEVFKTGSEPKSSSQEGLNIDEDVVEGPMPEDKENIDSEGIY